MQVCISAILRRLLVQYSESKIIFPSIFFLLMWWSPANISLYLCYANITCFFFFPAFKVLDYVAGKILIFYSNQDICYCCICFGGYRLIIRDEISIMCLNRFVTYIFHQMAKFNQTMFIYSTYIACNFNHYQCQSKHISRKSPKI